MRVTNLIAWSLILIGLQNCKKEKHPDDVIKPCTERCNYFSDFTGHRWSQVGDYQDSSIYALNNIGLIPLPTSYSFSFDSCELDNEWIINSNGTSYGLNHVKCQPSEEDTFEIPDWKFSDDRKFIIFSNASSLYIESITPSYMKFYYYFTSNIPGKGPTKFVRLQLYKSI